MIIESIELKNFRNYERLDIEFSPSTNILYGENARGKTNILEAAYMSGTSKSHRGSRDREIIRFDQDEAHVRTRIIKNDKSYQVDIHLKGSGRKGIAVNHVPLKRAADIFGILNIIFFSPEDLAQVIGIFSAQPPSRYGTSSIMTGWVTYGTLAEACMAR